MRKSINLLLLIALVAMAGLALAADVGTAAEAPGWLESIMTPLLAKYGVLLGIFILGFIAAKYLKPWVHETPNRIAGAQEIAFIADRITDEMVLENPEVLWMEWIDKAVDKLIASTDLIDADDSRGIAHREIASQIVKRALPGLVKG